MNQDGYSPVFEVLKKHSVTVKFVCSAPSLQDHEALADPEGLSWQVMVIFSHSMIFSISPRAEGVSLICKS